MKSVLDDMKEKHRRRIEELYISIEANKERHQQEINEIKNKEEEVIAALKKVNCSEVKYYSVVY